LAIDPRDLFDPANPPLSISSNHGAIGCFCHT
jgi:hypothetical protein